VSFLSEPEKACLEDDRNVWLLGSHDMDCSYGFFVSGGLHFLFSRFVVFFWLRICYLYHLLLG